MDKVIGHRGACAYAPENTLASFKKAYDLGCRWIEFDVMCSADGVPFIIHDDTVNRTTNAKGQVGLMHSSVLDGLDAGMWFDAAFQGEPVPRLHQIVQWLNTTNMNANIEIKPFPGAVEHTTKAVIQAVKASWPKNKTWPLVSSFEWQALTLCRDLAPELPLGFLLYQWDKDWLAKAKTLQCYSIHLNHKALTQKRVDEIKQEGYIVCAYTVNSLRLAKQLIQWGVDALFSDYPDLLSI